MSVNETNFVKSNKTAQSSKMYIKSYIAVSLCSILLISNLIVKYV